MAKIIVKNIATGTLILNGVSNGIIASIDTSNILTHNLDNCVIFVEGTLLCGSSNGRVTVHKAHAVFKKISGTITAPSGLSGVDVQLEEAPLMVGAITYSLNISGNIINFQVNNTSVLNITVEAVMDLTAAFAAATYSDSLRTFP